MSLKPARKIQQGPLPGYVRRGYRNSQRRKKLSFDLHGVVDSKPDLFRILFRDLIREGWEIHIVTGAPWKKEQTTLRKLRIPFTHFFSIVDYHVSIGTPIEWDFSGNAHIEPYLWDRTKALYCAAQHITMHLDDSDTYGHFFKTPYLRYNPKDSERDQKTHL